MLQSEIDEISEAFMDAWEEYFGQVMYYVPLLDVPTKHPIYGESKTKDLNYDFANKVMFHGTFKESPIEEKGGVGGKDEKQKAEITFVTQELYSKGIKAIDPRAVIEITHRDGTVLLYNIVKRNGKVQLGDNHVFTKLDVVDIK